MERDLTGDGKADFVIDHRGIWCGEAGMSGFCGAQLCTVLIYVREGALLRLSLDTMSGTLQISAGRRPTISLAGHGGAITKFRWNGRRFD